MLLFLDATPCCVGPEWQTAIATWALVAFTLAAAGAASYAAFYAYRTFRLERDGSIVITITDSVMADLLEGALELRACYPRDEESWSATGIKAGRLDSHWMGQIREGRHNFPVTWLSFSNPGRTAVAGARITFCVSSYVNDDSEEAVQGELVLSLAMVAAGGTKQFAIVNAHMYPAIMKVRWGEATALSGAWKATAFACVLFRVVANRIYWGRAKPRELRAACSEHLGLGHPRHLRLLEPELSEKLTFLLAFARKSPKSFVRSQEIHKTFARSFTGTPAHCFR